MKYLNQCFIKRKFENAKNSFLIRLKHSILLPYFLYFPRRLLNFETVVRGLLDGGAN